MFDPDLLLRQLSELGRLLDAQIETLGECDLLATGLGCEYQRLREECEDRVAEEFLKAEGTVETRKMIARLKAVPSRLIAQDALLEAEKAKARLRTQQAAIRALHARVEIGRSLLSHEKTRLDLDRLPEAR
jgi:hypothetical protein